MLTSLSTLTNFLNFNAMLKIFLVITEIVLITKSPKILFNKKRHVTGVLVIRGGRKCFRITCAYPPYGGFLL